MTIFDALTTGLSETDRNLTLDVIQQRLADDQAAARQGHPHRNIEEVTRHRRSVQASRAPADGDVEDPTEQGS